MVTETTFVAEGKEYPAVEIDGRTYPLPGGPPHTPEALEEFERDVRLSQWKEDTTDAAVAALGIKDSDHGGWEALNRIVWDLLDAVEPYSLTVHQLEPIARFLAGNEPLMEFLRCQQLEALLSEAQNFSGAPVVGGPTHRAVQAVRVGLEALTGDGSE